jgi:hypothetical protein
MLKESDIAIPQQKKVYSEWFLLSAKGMTSDHKKEIDNVRKIDPSNLSLFDILYRYYSRNIATISFWLKYTVFPVETEQFQNKLVATAWNLANNVDIKCRGFSGTSDNRLLLPLQVRHIYISIYIYIYIYIYIHIYILCNRHYV